MTVTSEATESRTSRIDAMLDAARERLVRLSAKVVLDRAHVVRAEEIVVAESQRAGQLDSGDFKGLIGSTRKYA